MDTKHLFQLHLSSEENGLFLMEGANTFSHICTCLCSQTKRETKHFKGKKSITLLLNYRYIPIQTEVH